MKPAYLKKNTKGGAAGISWEAGEVKSVNPYLAEELVALAPDDYEIVQEGEYTPEPPAHNSPGFDMPVATASGDGVKFEYPKTTVIEVLEKEPVVPRKATKPKATTKKTEIPTETPSAE